MQTSSITKYTVEFNSLVAILGWPQDAQLRENYYKGLKPHVKDAMAVHGVPATMHDLIAMATRIDNRHFAREQEKKGKGAALENITPRAPPKDPNAKDLRGARGQLTQAEKTRRMKNGLCLYCEQKGHFARECPNKKRKGARIQGTEEGKEEENKEEPLNE